MGIHLSLAQRPTRPLQTKASERRFPVCGGALARFTGLPCVAAQCSIAVDEIGKLFICPTKLPLELWIDPTPIQLIL